MNINTIKNSAIFGRIIRIFSSIFAGILIAVCLLGIAIPETSKADLPAPASAAYVAKASNEIVQKALRTIKVVVTAYSSTPDQTDDTPFITASGKRVAENIVANNMLPFGTKIKIPALYGDKIFIIGDRMNKRYDSDHLDLWMPTRDLALKFGVKKAEIQILEN